VRELPSGTVTFLFTDIEGSTRLLHELGDAYADALAEHRRVLRDAFERHGGVEVDTQGDAFFVAFARASDALAAARESQSALSAGPVRVRMGVHTGEPLLTEEGYVGLDVHRAARIAAAGHGSQVLVSQSTRDLGASDSLRDLGKHRLKDLTAPERIYQLGDAEFPPLKTLYRTNLPVPATPFLGRERELAEVRELLGRSDVRLLTLTGAGGSGKTRLALQAAAALAEAYPEGVWWAALAPIAESDAVLEAAARALGTSGSLADGVGDRRLLLLLDNFEHVIDAAPQLPTLLARCPRLDLLVTSRERLRVAGEQVYPVPVLARADAIDLFTVRARAAEPVFEPDELVADLCARLDDLPLALELAAARTSMLSTAELLERLGERLDLLRGGRDADARQQTLRATIEWSYDLLDARERQLFARLAVFAGGCTLRAAEEICGARLETLESLVDKSLVRLRADRRFWMLETIREFALERLAEASDADEVGRRHAQFFLALAESAHLSVEAYGMKGRERFDLVLPEQANLRSALDWAARAAPELGLRIAIALEQFWVTHAPFEGARRFEALLDRADDAPRVLRARALRALGGSLAFAGEAERAQHANARGLELFREAGDDAGATTMVFRLGTGLVYLGELDRARVLLEQSLAGFCRLGNRTGEAEALGNLGTIELREGKRERGRELIEQSIAVAREVGFTWWEAGKLGELALSALEGEETEQGERWAADSLRLSRDTGGRQRLVPALAQLAWAAAQRRDIERAGRLWGAVEAEERRGRLGAWEAVRGRYESGLASVAGADFERARETGRSLSLEEAVAWALRP
jgi:predicted ATPase/class 3 adenylate cyclase